MSQPPRRSPRRLARVSAPVDIALPAAKSSLAYLGLAVENVPREARREPRHLRRRSGSPLPPVSISLTPRRRLSPETRGGSPFLEDLLAADASRGRVEEDHFYRLTVAGSLKDSLNVKQAEEQGRKRPAESVGSETGTVKRPHLDGARRRETLQALPELPASESESRSKSPARDPGERKELRERIRRAFLETLEKERSVECHAAKERAERARRLKDLDARLRGRRRERTPDKNERKNRAVETDRLPEVQQILDEIGERKSRARTRERGVGASPRKERSPEKWTRKPGLDGENVRPGQRFDAGHATTGAFGASSGYETTKESGDALANLFGRNSRYPGTASGGRFAHDPWAILEVLARRLDSSEPPTTFPQSSFMYSQQRYVPQSAPSSTYIPTQPAPSQPPTYPSPDAFRAQLDRMKVKLDYPEPLPRPATPPQSFVEYSVPGSPPEEQKKPDFTTDFERTLEREQAQPRTLNAKPRDPEQQPPVSLDVSTVSAGDLSLDIDVPPPTGPSPSSPPFRSRLPVLSSSFLSAEPRKEETGLTFSPPDPKAEARDRALLAETRMLIGKLEHLVVSSPPKSSRSPNTPTTAVNGGSRRVVLERERERLIKLLGSPGVGDALEGVNLELEMEGWSV